MTEASRMRPRLSFLFLFAGVSLSAPRRGSRGARETAPGWRPQSALRARAVMVNWATPADPIPCTRGASTCLLSVARGTGRAEADRRPRAAGARDDADRSGDPRRDRAGAGAAAVPSHQAGLPDLRHG